MTGPRRDGTGCGWWLTVAVGVALTVAAAAWLLATVWAVAAL